jgi:hypothetical protein
LVRRPARTTGTSEESPPEISAVVALAVSSERASSHCSLPTVHEPDSGIGDAHDAAAMVGMIVIDDGEPLRGGSVGI